MPTLFDPIRMGALELPNRLVMAPLTRCRASEGRVPNDLMVEYYRLRAQAGLIVTEATSVSAQGVGYPDTPGIWSEAQVAGWKKVVDAVHLEGGRIVLQLWHVGRLSDPHFLNGEKPVAPSAVPAGGMVSLLRPQRPYPVPRALDLEEIPWIIAAYRRGAQNAREAGFDGVEIHGANGYLPNQFLYDGSNLRTDRYGGSLENRARFLFEAVDAAISVWGAERVGLHISPSLQGPGLTDSNLRETFTYVAREAKRRGLAFLFARESDHANKLGPTLRQEFGGAYIVNDQLTQQSAAAAIERGEADAVAFGRLFIANPDLPKRFQLGRDLNHPDATTFYAEGRRGYLDYPLLAV